MTSQGNLTHITSNRWFSLANLYFIIILLPWAPPPQRHKSMACRWECYCRGTMTVERQQIAFAQYVAHTPRARAKPLEAYFSYVLIKQSVVERENFTRSKHHSHPHTRTRSIMNHVKISLYEKFMFSLFSSAWHLLPLARYNDDDDDSEGTWCERSSEARKDIQYKFD